MTASDRLAEAARTLVEAIDAKANIFRFSNEKNLLRDAVIAYESEAKAGEDRVREAAMRVNNVLPTAWNGAEWDAVYAALRPYVIPAPPNSDGVLIGVDLLRHAIPLVKNQNAGFCNDIPREEIAARLTALLPKPAAKEPSAELQEKWAAEAFHSVPTPIARDGTAEELDCWRSGYVAALRAAWEAETKGGV